MTITELPPSPVPGVRTIELVADCAPLLQRFFDANCDYFVIVNGEPTGPTEAHDEIHGELPTGWSFSKRWLIGYVDADGALVAMPNVVSDLLAPGVWHVGLFMVAASQQGTGLAQTLHRGLESWARANGARWLRLGVVQGNARAERFWQSQGFVETRIREDVAMGKRVNTLRVMVKPLLGGALPQYLALIERDRPEPHTG